MSEWDEIKTTWAEKDEFAARTDKRTDKSGLEELEIKKFNDYHKKTFDIIRELKFTIPRKNETITLLTTKSFSSIGLLDYIISVKNYPIEAIFFIYSLNSQVAQRINEICEKSNRSKIIISDLQNTAFRNKEKAVLENLNSDKCEKIFVHSHAKIISIKYKDESFTILGSGNLAANARVEQYQITNSNDMYCYFENAFEEMKQIKVKQRNENLWK
jgi:hypothetical protein